MAEVFAIERLGHKAPGDDPVEQSREQIEEGPGEQKAPHGRPDQNDDQRRDQSARRNHGFDIGAQIEPVEHANDAIGRRHPRPQQGDVEPESHVDEFGIERERFPEAVINDEGDHRTEHRAGHVDGAAQPHDPPETAPVLETRRFGAELHDGLPGLEARHGDQRKAGREYEREVTEVLETERARQNGEIGDGADRPEALAPHQPGDILEDVEQTAAPVRTGSIFLHCRKCHSQS